MCLADAEEFEGLAITLRGVVVIVVVTLESLRSPSLYIAVVVVVVVVEREGELKSRRKTFPR